jgi:hypothetical protein
MRFMHFAEYASTHLDAVAFEPDFEKAEEQVFAASLASFRSLALGWIGQRNASGMAFDLDAGFIERMTPNALADLDQGRHMIVMHQALMATIVDLCLFLFTQSNQFPAIGDAAAEASPSFPDGDAPGLYLLRMTLEGRTVERTVDHLRVPKDADRHVAAIYMAMLMARFVWLHELAHCVNGHVLLLKDHSMTARLNEVAEPAGIVGQRPIAGAEDMQALRYALELDADRTALDWLVRVQLEGLENIPGLLGYDDLTRLEMALLGSYLMTWLFQEYQTFMDARHGVTHPAPRMRLGELAKTLHTMAPAMLVIEERVRAAFNLLEGKLPGLSPFMLMAETPQPLASLAHKLAPYRFT